MISLIESHSFYSIFVNAVRERLVIEGNIFGDLMAINIQRARDHGLPGYAHYREVLGLGAVNSFDDISDSFSSEQIARFKAVYKNVKDIDVFPGCIAETPLPGSQLGPVNTHLILKQMQKFREGDRFWYERDDHLTAFTIKQLDEIRKATMARVMCDNLDGTTRTLPWVFKTRASGQEVVDCADLDYVDLKEFSQGNFYLFRIFLIYSIYFHLPFVNYCGTIITLDEFSLVFDKRKRITSMS